MEADEFSDDKLKDLNQMDLLLPSVADVKPKHNNRQTESFLRGPVPISWLIKAKEVAGGNGLMLGIGLWWISGMTGSKTFSVNVSRLDSGQSQRSKWRVLKTLEDAGLIRRITEPGKRLKVELLTKKQATRGPP